MAENELLLFLYNYILIPIAILKVHRPNNTIIPDKSVHGSRVKTSIFALLLPYKGLVAVLVIFALAGNGINLILPLIVSRAIDSYIAGSFIIKTVIIQFLLASLFIALFNYLQGIVQTFTSEKAAKNLRATLSAKISEQSFTYVIQTQPSRLLTNLTSDIDSIKMFISQAFTSIVSSAFVIIGASILLVSINWKLGLAVLTIIPLIGGAFFMMLRKVRPLFRKSREVVDWLNRIINESIMGAMLIRILNAQHHEYKKFLEANKASRDLGLSILSMFAALVPFITFVSNMAILTVLALGGHFVITGEMTLGNIAAFYNYISILIFPILIIGFMSNAIAHAGASYARISSVLSIKDDPDTGSVVKTLSGEITISNLTLLYDEKPALKDINLQIKGGSSVAIIGPTAAGKTQLLYLLTRLLKPDEGSITFDGHTIEEYKKDVFHRQVGFVFQDSIIFNMSVRDNIAFGKEVPEALLQKAIETAELRNFINNLPARLDTIISERGTSLSGGQKQRIMLARALAINPRILLLDDFTARVDKRTEQKIMKNVHTNYPGITIINVTQKIEPIEKYEQIVLLMESELIASGRHEDLLRTTPEYVQIYNSQRSTNHYEL